MQRLDTDSGSEGCNWCPDDAHAPPPPAGPSTAFRLDGYNGPLVKIAAKRCQTDSDAYRVTREQRKCVRRRPSKKPTSGSPEGRSPFGAPLVPLAYAVLGQASHRIREQGKGLRRAYGGRKILRMVFRGRFPYEKSHFRPSRWHAPATRTT